MITADKKQSPFHRIPRFFAACLFIAAIFHSGCAARFEGDTEHIPVSPIDFYRGPLNHLEAVREGTCPMHPSCSAYAKEVYEKHGPVTGSVMTFDRLIRCGRDETSHAREIYIQGRGRYHDPVRYNDFWWYEKGDGQ